MERISIESVNKTRMILFGAFMRWVGEIFRDDQHFVSGSCLKRKEVWETERSSRVRHKIQFDE